MAQLKQVAPICHTGGVHVLMYYFSSDENLKQTWVKFVCRHRISFLQNHHLSIWFTSKIPVSSEELQFCYGGSERNFKQFLIKGTIPTRETAVPNSSPESERKCSPLLYSFAVPDRTLRTLSSQFRQSIPCDIFEEMVA